MTKPNASASVVAAGGSFIAHSLDARIEEWCRRFSMPRSPMHLLHRRDGERPWRTGYAATSWARFDLRAVAQSMARELAPQNIRGPHLVFDSGVDTAWVRERIAKSRGADAAADLPAGSLMNPTSIAETYWRLHRRKRDAWTHELDLRPFGETW